MFRGPQGSQQAGSGDHDNHGGVGIEADLLIQLVQLPAVLAH